MTKLKKIMLMVILFTLLTSILSGIVLADDISSIQGKESPLHFVDFFTVDDEINSMATDSEGNIYLTFELDESDDSFIKKFNNKGEEVKTWWDYKEDKFNHPKGITVNNEDGTDYVYVADTGNKQILKLTTSGEYVEAYNNGNYEPCDLSFDGQNNMYVTFPDLSWGEEIKKLVIKEDGTQEWIDMPSIMNGEVELSNNSRIATNTLGIIYVTNNGQAYSYYDDTNENDAETSENDDGTESSISEPMYSGFGPANILSSYYGIDIDKDNNLYVPYEYSDYSTHKSYRYILKYNSSIELIEAYGGEWSPTEESLLNRPSEITVDSKGNIYVVDGNKVKLLDIVSPDVTFTFTPTPKEINGHAKNYDVDVKLNDPDPASGHPEAGIFQYEWSTTSGPIEFQPINQFNTFEIKHGDDKDENDKPDLSSIYKSFGEEIGYLHVKVRDKAGNESVIVSDGYLFDKKGPEITYAPKGGEDARPDYNISVTASDVSGIVKNTFKYVVLTHDGKPEDDMWINFYSTTDSAIEITDNIKMSDTITESGIYYLWLYGEDKFVNDTLVNCGKYVLDTSLRNINITATGISANLENNTDYNQDYNIDVDTLSGDDVNIYYQWTDSNNQPDENSEDWIEPDGQNVNYGKKYSGTKYFHVKSVVDGNIYYDSRELLFDNEAPEITVSPNSSTTPKNNVSTEVQIQNNIDGQASKFYTKWILKSELSDNDDNWIDNINFTEDDITTEAAIVLDKSDGRYILFVKAVDVVGNEKVIHSGEFAIDNTSPTGSVEIQNTTVTTNVVVINLDAVDNLSDSNSIKYTYSIDNGDNWSEQWIPVSDGLELTLTSNEKLQDISVSVKYKDEAGNTSKEYSVSETIGYNPIGVTTWIEYSTTDWTNEDIVATLTYDEIYNGKIEILNNEGSGLYTFVDNGVFYFEIKDKVTDSIRKIRAQVYNIDREVSVPEIIKSTTLPTNESVTITLKPREEINILDNDGSLGYLFTDSDNDGSYEYDFTESGVYTLNLKDELNNTTSVAIEIDNIDKTPPVLSCSKSAIEATTEPVKVDITADEPIVILNNLGSNRRTFDENGSFTFKVEDYAGNTSEIMITVDNIDREPPKVWIEYSETNWTKESVVATIKSDEDFNILNNDGSDKFTFNENGRFYFKVSDDAGNEKMAEALVTNIDKISPRISFAGEEHAVLIKGGSEDALNDYVAHDNNDGNITDKVTLDKSEYDISVEGTYKIVYTVSDEAGNECEVIREVTVISSDQLKIYVNGIDADQDKPIIIDSKYINLNILNNQGIYKIKWKKGKSLQGNMKQNCNLSDGQAFHVEDMGWYTIYFQDQERNTKLIKIYAY